jgi:fatty acid-binding protein DegV
MIKKIIKFILSIFSLFSNKNDDKFNEAIFDKKEQSKTLLFESDKIKRLMEKYEETGDKKVLHEIRKLLSE